MAGDYQTDSTGHHSTRHIRRAYEPRPAPAASLQNEASQLCPDRPMKILDAIRHVAKVPLKHFYLATILEDGQAVYFTSPPGPHANDARAFFSERLFWKRYEGAATPESSDVISGPAAAPHDAADPNFCLRPDNGLGQQPSAAQLQTPHPQTRCRDPQSQTRHRFSDCRDAVVGETRGPVSAPAIAPRDTETPYSKMRKGMYGQRLCGDSTSKAADDLADDDLVIDIKPTVMQNIRLGDTKTLNRYYDSRFRLCQQSACKVIAKLWIRLLAPKKQTHHPYTGKGAAAPDWWPKGSYGPGERDKVRHREPDHLYKKERLYLLVHLLGLVTAPRHSQIPEVRRLELNVRRLQEITDDAMASFFADHQSPGIADKRPYLNELFKTAEKQEQYNSGGIDEDSTVAVNFDESMSRPMDDSSSDHETTSNQINQPDPWPRDSPTSEAKPATDTTTAAARPTPLAAPTTMLHPPPVPRSAEHGALASMPTYPSMPPLRRLPLPLPYPPSSLPSSSPSLVQPMLQHQDATSAGHSDYSVGSSVALNPDMPSLSNSIASTLHALSGSVPANDSHHLNPGRRTSLHSSPVDYHGSPGSSIYANSWHQPTTPASLFSFSAGSHQHPAQAQASTHANDSPHHHPSPFLPGLMSVSPLTHTAGHYMSSPFDPISSFDQAPPLPDAVYRRQQQQQQQQQQHAFNTLPPFGILPSTRDTRHRM